MIESESRAARQSFSSFALKASAFIATLVLIVSCPDFAGSKEFKDPEKIFQEAVAAYENGNWAAVETASSDYLRQAPNGLRRPKAALLLAEAYLRHGKFEDAIKAYEASNELASKDSFAFWSAKLRMAECQQNLNQPTLALKSLQSLAREAPFSILRTEALVDEAYVLLQLGKDAEAGSALQNLMAANTQYRDDPRVGKALGYFLLRTNSAVQGYDAFARAAKFSDANDPSLLFLQAMTLEAMGKHPQSLQILQQITQVSKDEYWRGEALYQIAQSFLRQGMFDLARKTYSEVLPLSVPSRLKAKAVLQLGSISLSQKQYIETEELAQKILAAGKKSDLPINKDPILWGAQYLMAETALKTSQWVRAKSIFEKLVQVPEIAMEAKLKLIWLDLKQNEFNRAVDRANEFLQQYPWGEAAGHALLLRGMGYLKGGNVEMSIRDFIQFLDKYVDHPLKERATYLLALSYLQSKKWADLVSHISEAKRHLEPKPSIWQAGILLCLAEGHYNLEEYEKAMQTYQEFNGRFQKSGLSPYVYEGLAVSYAYLDKYEEALSAQTEAMDLAKQYKTQSILRYGLLALGNILFNKHNYKQSLSYDQTFIQQFPDDPNMPLILYRSGHSYDRLKKSEQALDQWNKLISRYPTSPYAPQAMLAMSRLYFNSDGEGEAQKMLSKLLEAYPQVPEAKEALILLGQSYFNQENYEQATSQFEAFLQRYPHEDRSAEVQKQLENSVYQMALQKHTPKAFLSRFPKHPLAEDLYWDLGLAAWKRKNYAEALELLQNLSLAFPESQKASRSLFLLGDIYFQQNRLPESISTFQSYLKNDAREENLVPGILFKIAIGYFRQNLYLEAAKAFQTFIEQYPKDPQVRDAYLNLILSDQKAEKAAEGAEACKQFLKSFPNDAESSHTYLQMGHMLKSIGQGVRAAEAYQKVNKTSPYAIEAYYSLGQWYQEQADYQKALKAYEVLVPMRPRENEQRLSGMAMLGEFYQRLGKTGEAIRAYREVAKFSQNADWVAGAKQKIATLQKESSQGGSQQ